MLTQQGDRDDTIFLVLDGVFDVDMGGQTVAEIGPGAVVGERGSLEGRRSATLRARTDCRVVALAPSSLTREEREQLAAGHRREDD
jgi:CRP-like cAMP-binding protein